MISLIRSWFQKDPTDKLQKAYKRKLTEAMWKQRDGDIRGYAELTAEAEAIKEQLDNVSKNN
jgi:histidinol phosphatase-like enzyme